MACRYILCSLDEALIHQWKEHLAGYDNVLIKQDSFFRTKCAAVVSPANSSGMMRGGLDYYLSLFFDRNTPELCREFGMKIDAALSDPKLAEKLRPRLYWSIEKEVRRKINQEYGGTLPVGEAIFVKTGHRKMPFLISAPTMEKPGRIYHPEQVYNCMQAIIRLAERENLSPVLVPGLGTGVGGLKPSECAKEMERAFAERYNK